MQGFHCHREHYDSLTSLPLDPRPDRGYHISQRSDLFIFLTAPSLRLRTGFGMTLRVGFVTEFIPLTSPGQALSPSASLRVNSVEGFLAMTEGNVCLYADTLQLAAGFLIVLRSYLLNLNFAISKFVFCEKKSNISLIWI